MLKLTGTATQVNGTSAVQYSMQTDGFVYYDTVADASLATGPTQVFARAIGPTTGLPTGSELRFALPTVVGGYLRSNFMSGLRPLSDGSFLLQDVTWNSAIMSYRWEYDRVFGDRRFSGNARVRRCQRLWRRDMAEYRRSCGRQLRSALDYDLHVRRHDLGIAEQNNLLAGGRRGDRTDSPLFDIRSLDANRVLERI